MLVTIIGNHAKHAPLLSELLGASFRVVGRDWLAADDTIDSDVIVTTKVSESEAPRMRCTLLQVPGAGLDAIALDHLPPGTRVCNAYEHEAPIAEYVTHAVLDYFIFPTGAAFPMDADNWAQTHANRQFHAEAGGKHAALIGFGRIGRAVASRLRALGMTITAIRRNAVPSPEADFTRPVSELLDALSAADAVIVCCPLDATTKGLIGPAQFQAMRRDALLVNVARGEVIDEDALFSALRQGLIGRAVLDVWYRYPDGKMPVAPSRYPFHTLANARCTPHVSGWTWETISRRYAVIAENVRRLSTAAPLINAVQRHRDAGAKQ